MSGRFVARQDDQPAAGVEAVHLDQQLVERLLALVVALADAGAALAPDGVELVDEHDRRRRRRAPCANRSRMRAAPTPTSDSTNSAPETEKNAACASPAVARASSVLPVPGGPTSSAPFGGRAPSARVALGGAQQIAQLLQLGDRAGRAGDVARTTASPGCPGPSLERRPRQRENAAHAARVGLLAEPHEQREQRGEDQDRQQHLHDQAPGLLAALRVDHDRRALRRQLRQELVLQRAVGRVARPALPAGPVGDQEPVVVVQLGRVADLARRPPCAARSCKGSSTPLERGWVAPSSTRKTTRRRAASAAKAIASGSKESLGRRTKLLWERGANEALYAGSGRL